MAPVKQLQYEESLDGEGEEVGGGPGCVVAHHPQQSLQPRVSLTVPHFQAGPSLELSLRASVDLHISIAPLQLILRQNV